MPLLSDPTIPDPSYIICDVGATVVHGDTLQPVHSLQIEIDRTWPGEHVVDHFEALQREVPQERRCSYFCDAKDVTPKVIQIIERLDLDLVFSAERYFDVLPKGVNKGGTLAQLIDYLKLSSDQVLVGGDTLNDLSMFEQAFKGVCVGASIGTGIEVA